MRRQDTDLPRHGRHVHTGLTGLLNRCGLEFVRPEPSQLSRGPVQAIGHRLRRNYVFIFTIVLGGWIVKIMIHPRVAESWQEFWSRMAVGHIPPSVIVFSWLVFGALIGGAMWYARHLCGGEPEDEIAGLERNLEHWKL